jgi:hypothetical protein
MNYLTQPQGFTGKMAMARRDITPPLGIYSRCWGAAMFDCATEIHRPFSVTALVTEADDGRGPYVLLGFDGFVWSEPESEWLCRSAVIEALETRPERVIISISHTHGGVQLTTDNNSKPGGEHIEPYIQFLKKQFVEAAVEARDNMQQMSLDWRVSHCDLATHRDFKDPFQERYTVGFNPDAPADDTVLVGRLSNAEGKLLGVVVNYACHPTTLAWDNTHLSPDYIGALRATVEKEHPDALCLFLIGACGELSPAHQYVGDVELADSHGRRLAYSVLQALEGLPPAHKLALQEIKESGAPLAVWKPEPATFPKSMAAVKLSVPIKIKPDWFDIAAIEAELEASDDRILQERLLRKLRVRKSLDKVKDFRLDAWVWLMGNTIFVGSSAEHYSYLQTSLRNEFPNNPVVVMNLINGANGYLPEEALYKHDIYSVWQTPYAKGGLEAMQEAMSRSVRHLLSEMNT